MLSLSRCIPSLFLIIVCLAGCSKAAPTSVPTPMTADDRAEPVPIDQARLPGGAEEKTEPQPLPADDKKKAP